jgi:hypothetical protein
MSATQASATAPAQGASGSPQATRAALALLLAALVAGVARAIWLAWTCDDAFVSFRYAENLVDGAGLVYNAGERVEGYTNLLWTLLLAAGIAAGFDPQRVGIWLGIACYVGLAGTLARESWRRHREHALPFLPLAAGAVLVSDDFHEWATGGLETALFTWLATAALVQARRACRSTAAALGAGALLALLLLTRPDGVLFAAAAAATLLVWPPGGAAVRSALRTALWQSVLPAATLALWLAWKLAYYGELLPTAFHSKSVLRPWYTQGLVYLGLYLAKNWFLAPALAGALLARWLRRGSPRSDVDRDGAALAAGAALFLLYLAHVGGDFMFARRVLPAVPLLLLAVEGELVRLPLRGARAATLACVAAAALPYPVLGDRALLRGVADERRFYHAGALAARRLQGHVVGEALAGTDARVMFEGGMCAFGYFSRLPWQAEMSGLTHYSLAKLPLAARGRPGHEKQATEEWLDQQGVHFVVSQRFPPIPRPTSPAPLDAVYFGDVAMARIHRYDDAIMERLRQRPDVRFTPIERVLEQRRREILRADRAEALRLYAWLERYYLAGAGERGRVEARALREIIERKTAGDPREPGA